jgi:hypothetical protein
MCTVRVRPRPSGDDVAIGVEGVEMDIGMRIDEVETGQRAFYVELASGIEAADAVVRPRWSSEHDDDECERDSHGCRLPCN